MKFDNIVVDALLFVGLLVGSTADNFGDGGDSFLFEIVS